jgi:hypothetical protein
MSLDSLKSESKVKPKIAAVECDDSGQKSAICSLGNVMCLFISGPQGRAFALEISAIFLP